MTRATSSRLPAPKISDLVCCAIYAAGHAFNRVYKPLLEPLGLTYPQYLVMIALWEQDDQTVGALGERMSLESNTLTPLLKRMEAAGHIRRTRDARDERQVRIRLTAEGERLRTEASGIPGCVLEATGMSVEDLIRLRTQLGALRDALESYDASRRENPPR